MWSFFWPSRPRYNRIQDDDDTPIWKYPPKAKSPVDGDEDCEAISRNDFDPARYFKKEKYRQAIGIASRSVAVLLLLAVVWCLTLHSSRGQTGLQDSQCGHPIVRTEWRQMSNVEQASYIAAVQCLHLQPAKIAPAGRQSDDFPWVHRQMNHYSAFLSHSRRLYLLSPCC